MLAPALLAALVATAALTSGQRLVVDARAVGVVVAAIAIWRRAPVLLVVVLAAAAAALSASSASAETAGRGILAA